MYYRLTYAVYSPWVTTLGDRCPPVQERNPVTVDFVELVIVDDLVSQHGQGMISSFEILVIKGHTMVDLTSSGL